MTITFYPIYIPIILEILLIIACWLSLATNNTYFAGAFEVLSGMFGTLFIWLTYFATMYFITIW